MYEVQAKFYKTFISVNYERRTIKISEYFSKVFLNGV